MKNLILWITLLLSSLTFAENKDGGNGQLVVIPKGQTKPVPYEAVRAWETGKYLNFYRLPNINGNIEPREKFNRHYGVYALEWLELIKKLSPILHRDLINAANNTSFRIVNELITWKHQPYPDGAVQYKSYQKAAFYNGEIIFSTPVMDKVGPLKDQLTSQQNQGFIVVHELINASYPEFSVDEKLKIGEAIIRAKIFNDSTVDFYYNLSTINPYFLSLLSDAESFEDLINELSHYENNQENLIFYKKVKEYAKNYAYTKSSISEVAAENIIAKKLITVEAINAYLADVNATLGQVDFTFKQSLVTFESLKEISKKLNISLADLLSVTDPISEKSFVAEGHAYIYPKFEAVFLGAINTLVNPIISSTKSLLQHYYNHVLKENALSSLTQSTISQAAEQIPDVENLGFKKLNSLFIPKLINSNLESFTTLIENSVSTFFCSKGICIDKNRTIAYAKWYNHSLDPMNPIAFPFRKGDFFLRLASSDSFALYSVDDVDLKDKVIETRLFFKRKRKYGVDYRDREMRKTIYGINSNLEELLFLDLAAIKNSGFDIKTNPNIWLPSENRYLD